MNTRRKLPPGCFGAMTGRVPPYAPPLDQEMGWLTPLRPAKAGQGYFIFRCRCGEEVSKIARNVRKSVEDGRTPKCDACNRLKEAKAS